MQRKNPVSTFHAEQPGLDHAQCIDDHDPVFHNGGAHQLHMQQILAEGAVGLCTRGVHGDIHENPDMPGRFRVVGIRVEHQVTAGI